MGFLPSGTIPELDARLERSEEEEHHFSLVLLLERERVKITGWNKMESSKNLEQLSRREKKTDATAMLIKK